MRTILITAVLLLALGSARAQQVVTVATEGAFPPWNATAPDGSFVGLDIDLIADLCKRADLVCHLQSGDWSSLIPGLNAGKYDAVLSVGINAARSKIVAFTVPYAQGAATFLVTKDGPQLPMTGQRLNLADHAAADPVMARIRQTLKGKSVGVVQSSSHEQLIRSLFGDDVDVRVYKGSQERDFDLRDGRIDAGFDSAVYAEATLSKPGNEDIVVTGPLLRGPPLATDVAIALRFDETVLKDRLDRAIQAAAADGTIRAISEHWSKLDLTPGP